MKKQTISIILLFLLVFLQASATGQSGDVIYIQGDTWELLGKPIWADSTLNARLETVLPKNRIGSTANAGGYTAFWEIQNDSLFLQQIKVAIYNEDEPHQYSTLTLEAEQLKTVFTSYYKQGKIHARWYSGTLRVAQGKTIRYIHSGFNRNTETEQIMTLKKGKVLQSEIYHNYRRPGFYLNNIQHEITKRFPWEQFPEYKGRRLSFRISDLQVTEDGHLLDCNVIFLAVKPRREKIICNNQEMEKAFKETLKSIYPWEVLYIYNKITTQNLTYVIPIQENPKPGRQPKDNPPKCSLIVKVYGEKVRQSPPFDVERYPLAACFVSSTYSDEGYVTDSTGSLRMDGLEKGRYCSLKAEFPGLQPCNKTIILNGQTDTLQLVLPLR